MAGTIEINGTGGIIEGNLGAANVNVNLDSALYFSGDSSDSVSDHVTMGDVDLITTGSFTLSAWIRPLTNTTHGATIIGKQQTYNTNALGYGLYWRASTNAVYFNVGDGSNGDQLLSGDLSGHVDSWIHIAGTYNASSKAMVLYVNGVSVDTGTASGVGDLSASNSHHLRLGANGTDPDEGDAHFKGYIADARIYSYVHDQPAIARLAAKINVIDPHADSNYGLVGWWKCNDGSGSNIVDHHNVGTDFDGTFKRNDAAYSTDIWKFDQYYVDVYDGYDGSDATTRTTTDGTFTVTQGKVEGLALSSLAFDGTNDRLGLGNGLTVFDGATQGAFSAWVRRDATGASHTIISHYDSTDSNRQFIFLVNGSDKAEINVQNDKSSFTSGHVASGTTTISANEWYHIVGTFSTTNGQKIYVNGVHEATAATTIEDALDTVTSQANIASFEQGGSYSNYFNGDIKDLKLYTQELSADQVASLYSNTLPITPEHNWKLDDSIQGVTTDTAVDSGTTGGMTGTIAGITASGEKGEAGVDSGWQNGTLDLDGTLTIAANGTLSAPRGTLQLSDDFTIAADTSTFTHNNGTVEILGNVELFPADYDSSENERHIFYNIAHTSHTLYIERPTIIENQYTKSGGTARQYTKTTFGTATSAGTMTINSGTWDFYGYYGSPTLQGANQLYPLVVTGSGYSSNGPIDWDTVNNEARSPDTFNYIKWIDFQKDMVTGGNGGDAVMLGDCEFDAFTISSGDSLDLNGQRAEFSGLLSSSGTIECNADDGTNALVVADSVNTSSATTGNMNLIETGDGHTHRLTSSTITTWMLNGGTITNSAHGHMADNIIVGAGKFDVGHNVASGTPLVNVTTATGAELDGNTFEIPLSGDFTTSGGLIGKSALNLTGSEEVTGSDNLDEVATTNKFTIEAWFKASTDANYRAIFSRGTSWGTGNLYVYMNGDGNVQASSHDLSNTLTSTTAGLADSKWHHVAYTYDTTTIKLYIDGKLEATAASTSGINTQTAGFKIGDRDGANWVGNIGRVSVWKNALSETLIRKMFFMDWTTMAADSDFTDSDAIGWWQFDEGTSTAVEDLSSQSNDGTLNSAAWAGAGTFTYGTSTLVMAKSGTQTLNYRHVEEIYNLTINDGSTTQIQSIGDANGLLDINNNLTVNEKLKSHADSAQARIRIASAAKTITIGSDVKTTALSELYSMEIEHSGSTNVPELTTPRLLLDNTATAVATGNLTITEELDLKTGTTFNANGNTIACKALDVNGGTLDLSNSTMNFSVTSSGDDLSLSTSSTLLTGNTTLSGHSSATPTPTTMGSAGNFEVVGNVSNLALQGGGDLTVVGSVTNCTFADSTANIHQFFHTLDTQQLLDADEKGDDDLKLTRPSLDNALQLQTGG